MAPQVPKPFFLLMEDGNKVVLFYISNALIQDIPFWPLFVLATAAQQQEEKNGTTSVILLFFFRSGLLGRLGQPVEHGHMDIMRETLSFHHHVSWHCYPDLSKKCLAHLWCYPHFVHASAAEGIFRVPIFNMPDCRVLTGVITSKIIMCPYSTGCPCLPSKGWLG